MAIWTSAYHSRSLPPILSIFSSPIPAHRRHRQHHPGVLLEPHFRLTPRHNWWAAALCKYFYSDGTHDMVWHGLAWRHIFNRFSSLAVRKIKQTTPDPIPAYTHTHTYVCCPAILPLVLIFGLSARVGACVYVCVCVYCVFLAASVETPPA